MDGSLLSMVWQGQGMGSIKNVLCSSRGYATVSVSFLLNGNLKKMALCGRVL